MCSRPLVPSRARSGVGCAAHEAAVDGVGQAPFEHRRAFSVAFAGGAFALVVGASGVSWLIWMMHDVEAMIELAIPGAGQPVADDVTGGGLDGAVPV